MKTIVTSNGNLKPLNHEELLKILRSKIGSRVTIDWPIIKWKSSIPLLKKFLYTHLIYFYKDFFAIAKSFHWEFYLYENIVEIKILTDDDKKISSTIAGGIVAGGLGALAENIRKNNKYYIQLKYKNNFIESFECTNYVNADTIYNSIKANLNIDKIQDTNDNTKLENLNLKKKLTEIKKLKEEGLLTEKEYNLKRKQIIDRY